MNDIVLIVLSLSVSGSFMALFLFVGKPFMKKYISRACSYYIWILVLLRLVIPFSLEQNVMNRLFNNVLSNHYVENEILTDNDEIQDSSEQLTSSKEANEIVLGDTSQQSITNTDQVQATVNDVISLQTILTIIWLTGACITLLFYIIPYTKFKVTMKATNAEPDQEDIAVLHNICAIKKLRLQYNSHVSTPMLIGIISPYIVIPGCNYVKSGRKQELENILCHEVMHYRRKDLIYKWFTVVVTSLHWFNPLMIPIRRQISRSCELSCDEAVIRNMNAVQKQSYGETLLSMAADKRFTGGIPATTLCEEKRELKERLINIMRYKKQTFGMFLLSVIIIVMLTGCATILGSVSSADISNDSTKRENSEEMKTTDGFVWFGETSLIPEGTILPDTVVNTDDAMNEFYSSDNTIVLLAVIEQEDIYVYGLKENVGSGEEASYYCHGICVRQGNEIQVLDIDWGIYGDIPQIQYQDYDNDGQKELAMILRSASGTGLSLLDLHVMEKNSEGGFLDNSFTDWADQLRKMVMHEVDDDVLKLYINGEQIDQIELSAFEEEWGEKFKDISFGNNVNFVFEDDRIYLQAIPEAMVDNMVTSQYITDTYIQMEVHYNDEFILQAE